MHGNSMECTENIGSSGVEFFSALFKDELSYDASYFDKLNVALQYVDSMFYFRCGK